MTFAELREQQQASGALFVQHTDGATIAHYGEPSREYQAALHGTALYDASTDGHIWMRDRDRAALLHRLSTNDINALQPGQGTQTVLTNHNGRIIALLTVHALDDQMLIVTGPQQGATVFNLLRKNIFFNDKVKLEQASADLGQFLLYGPQSAALLQELSGTPVADLPLHHIRAATIAGVSLWIARSKPIGGAGFALYAPMAMLPTLWASLSSAGAQPLGQLAYDTLRVEAGYPATNRELSLEYIPLETGLLDAISFNKGCYVGQEIIARMESRNRLAKQLRGLTLQGGGLPQDWGTGDQLLAPIAQLSLPAKLDVGGKEAGDLTSVVYSPRFGTIALAYVRTAYATPGTSIGIASSDVVGTVVELPFQQ